MLRSVTGTVVYDGNCKDASQTDKRFTDDEVIRVYMLLAEKLVVVLQLTGVYFPFLDRRTMFVMNFTLL